MILKRLALIAAALALAVGVAIPLSGRSDVAAATAAFNTSSAGPTGTLTSLNGSVAFCQVTVSSPTTGFTITPQVSADGVTWSAATTINNGSITAPGTYVGAVNGTNFPNFRINVGAVGSGNLVGYTVCTQSQPLPAYSPFPQATGNFGNLVCSGLASCSPSTGPTPAVAVPTPHATTTPCGAQPTISWPNVNFVAACATPFPVTGASTTPGPAAATFFCISDTVTASASSTSITFAPGFGTATASLSIIDDTDGTQVASSAVSAVSKTGFTFTSVSTKVYYFMSCGY